jgi:hypothetical protein
MIRLIQVIPSTDSRLFGQMVKKESELSRRGQGTFFRAGRKQRNQAKWSHVRYKGWIKLQRGEGEVVVAEIRSLSKGDDAWQLFHAFLGWLDRHFGKQIMAINIQYREA